MLSLFIFIFGLSVGSFLNVVICRLETKESFFFSRSHCPECGAVLKWYHLIPLLSFLIQKSRCDYCQKKISWQYPLVELTTGLLFLLVFSLQFSNPVQFSAFQALELFYYFSIISLLIVIFVYDMKHYLIPQKVVYPAIGLVLIKLAVDFSNKGFGFEVYGPLLAAFSAFGFFLLLVLASKGKWMGLGDVKLSFLMGLVLGWPNILVALFLSFFSGAIIGLILIVLGKKTMKSEIPFGPFLAASAIVVLIFGNLAGQKLFFEFF